jgi:hypothetical protein
MRKKLNHEVGSVYTKQQISDSDLDGMFMNIVASGLGILGISIFIAALAILPWSTL